MIIGIGIFIIIAVVFTYCLVANCTRIDREEESRRGR